MSKPWFGLHLPNYSFPDSAPAERFERTIDQARAAEECGLAQVTVMDHFFQLPGIGPESEPMLEAYTTLGALARETSRVRLGALVSGVTYRNPAFLVKAVTTLDLISGGRAMLGLGAAWNESEHIALGFDFPPVKERMDRLDDALAIAKGMFTQERTTYAGKFFHVIDAWNSPRPIQPGGPKIVVGGGGEQRTLRIAAKYADMTHWFASEGLEGLVRKADILRGYCAEIGRDAETIELTIGSPVVVVTSSAEGEAFLARLPAERRMGLTVGTPTECAARLRPYIDAGFTGFTFSNTQHGTRAAIDAVGETLRLVGG